MSKKIIPVQAKIPNHLASESDKVGEIAIHYGFTVLNSPQISTEDISKSKSP
jgi:hypothetical protein